MVTEISEDSVTAFYIFFLIKNYQRILNPNPLTQFFYFFVPQLLTKSHYIIGGLFTKVFYSTASSGGLFLLKLQQKSTAFAVLQWLPLLDLNQRHRD